MADNIDKLQSISFQGGLHMLTKEKIDADWRSSLTSLKKGTIKLKIKFKIKEDKVNFIYIFAFQNPVISNFLFIAKILKLKIF